MNGHPRMQSDFENDQLREPGASAVGYFPLVCLPKPFRQYLTRGSVLGGSMRAMMGAGVCRTVALILSLIMSLPSSAFAELRYIPFVEFEAAYAAGNYAEALPLAQRDARYCQTTFGEGDPRYASALNNLAITHEALNQVKEAEPLHAKALSIREKTLAPDHVDIAESAYRLGRIYRHRRHAEAESLLKRSLAIREKAFGFEDEGLVEVLDALAEVYEGQKRFAEAEVARKRALAIDEKVSGPEDANVAVSLANLAALYKKTKRFAEAEPLLLRTLAIREKVNGLHHAETALVVEKLAESYREMNRKNAALSYARRLLAMREQQLGPEHIEVARSLWLIGEMYLFQEDPDADQKPEDALEAERLCSRALAIVEKIRGPTHPDLIPYLTKLAEAYWSQARFAETEPLRKRALAIDEQNLGPDHPDVAIGLYELGHTYDAMARYSEAEDAYQRALALRERVLPLGDSATIESMHQLAALFSLQGRHKEALAFYQRALRVQEAVLGAHHVDLSGTLEGLAKVYGDLGMSTNAEQSLLRNVENREKALGPDHRDVAGALEKLARRYNEDGRHLDSELIWRRAIEVYERKLGVEHVDTLSALVGLAAMLRSQERLEEALEILKRATTASERTGDRFIFAVNLQFLAEVTALSGNFEEADRLHHQALKVHEERSGPSAALAGRMEKLVDFYDRFGRHGQADAVWNRALAMREADKDFDRDRPHIVEMMTTRAEFYLAQGRHAEAETLLGRARAISDSAADSKFFDEADEFLALLKRAYFRRYDWKASLSYLRRMSELLNKGNSERTMQRSKAKALSSFEFNVYRLHVIAAHRAGADNPEHLSEAFAMAQWALRTDAADAINQLAARQAAKEGRLAALVREQQDLVQQWRALSERLASALGSNTGSGEAADVLRRNLEAVDGRLNGIDAQLATAFPDYSALTNPRPLSIRATQELLGPGDALLKFIDTSKIGGIPEELYAWIVTKTEARWTRVSIPSRLIAEKIQALRCGLDQEEWEGIARAARCGQLLGVPRPQTQEPLPFHLGAAHELYKALLGPFEDLIKGKNLQVVLAGPLTSLPLHVLVTQQPEVNLPQTYQGYRHVAWLGRVHAITVIPAVASLSALRMSGKGNRAPQPYIGYGNPVLLGDSSCREYAPPDTCPRIEVAAAPEQPTASVGSGRIVRSRHARRSVGLNHVYKRGTGSQVLAQVRALCPLPDTAYELQCVARSLGVPDSEIRLAQNASEVSIKALSATSALSQYRIIHFATHGLLAGDLETMTRRRGEPALVMTPPEQPKDEDDDGLLTASEVSQLHLNADWVVLSACNTASGDKLGAEALSGLARAFIYAGARALLVSHWPVYSDAAVRLMTRTFSELAQTPALGRADALRRAMVAMIDDRSDEDNSHPAVWAPFVVVGESTR